MDPLSISHLLAPAIEQKHNPGYERTSSEGFSGNAHHSFVVKQFRNVCGDNEGARRLALSDVPLPSYLSFMPLTLHSSLTAFLFVLNNALLNQVQDFHCKPWAQAQSHAVT